MARPNSSTVLIKTPERKKRSKCKVFAPKAIAMAAFSTNCSVRPDNPSLSSQFSSFSGQNLGRTVRFSSKFSSISLSSPATFPATRRRISCQTSSATSSSSSVNGKGQCWSLIFNPSFLLSHIAMIVRLSVISLWKIRV